MESIIRSIQDPSWWFTTVFIAILASLTASYLRDVVTLIFSRFSTIIRTRRNLQNVREESAISLLVNHPQLLSMELVRTLIGIVLFLTVSMLYVCFPSFIVNLPELTEHRNSDFPHWIYSTILTAIGIMAIYTGYRITYRMKISTKAYRAYRKEVRRSYRETTTTIKSV